MPDFELFAFRVANTPSPAETLTVGFQPINVLLATAEVHDLLVHRLDALPQNAVLDRVDFSFHLQAPVQAFQSTLATKLR